MGAEKHVSAVCVGSRIKHDNLVLDQAPPNGDNGDDVERGGHADGQTPCC